MGFKMRVGCRGDKCSVRDEAGRVGGPAVNEAQPPEVITRLSESVYSPFAMLAGMQLDLFTPLEDGPLSAGEIADTLGVQVTKLRPLLYALVVAGC